MSTRSAEMAADASKARSAAGLALAGLTTRGRCFLAAGAASVGCGLFLGQRDLLRIAVLLVAAPVASMVVVGRTRFRLSCQRSVLPARVRVNQPAQVRVRLANLTRSPTRVLLVEDSVPYPLGARARFVVERLHEHERACVTYSVHSDVRGRFEIGPLRLRVADPFGMCEVVRSFSTTDPVVVAPVVHPLQPLRGRRFLSGSAESASSSASAAGDDAVAIREYRHGDDLRKVHWRSTARRGELMVRREEQPRRLHAAVLLDRRAVAHHGEGAGSSFEWAVSATASVAVHLLNLGYRTRLLTGSGGGRTAEHGADGPMHEAELLDRLATVDLGEPRELTVALQGLPPDGAGLIVAVLGAVDPADVRPLARLARRDVRGVVLLLRTPEWAAAPHARAAPAGDATERARLTLARTGWDVVTAGPRDTVPQAWSRLLPGDPARPPRLTGLAGGRVR